MTDLEALISAVEAGLSWPADSEQWDTIGVDGMDAADAYNGSLDAALRLHEALLPGWAFAVASVDQDGRGLPMAIVMPDASADNDNHTTVRSDAIPARAWLLAILKAYRAGL